ncbi:restriction endonuclease subunit S [Vibrio parahaemolyticus]
MVPNGWESVRLSKISEIVTSGSRDWAQYYSDSGSKFIRMTNLPRDGIYLKLDDLKFVNVQSDSSDGKRTSLKEGDLLISITAELGKVGWVPPELGEAYINQHTALVRIRKDCAESKYVAYLLSSHDMNHKINRLNDSGAKAGLNLPTIRSIPMALPPLPEQRKIAKILSTWDKAISTTEKLIETSKQQKKALMQQLLTGKKRLVNPETGKVFEGEWEEVKLGDAVHIGRGFAFKSGQYASTGTKIVRVTNIASSGHIDLSDCVFVPKDIAGEYQKYALKSEDVLLVMVGATAGKLGFVTPEILPSLLNQNMWSLRTKDNCALHQSFLKQIAEQIVSRYMLTQQGSARGFFTQSTFELVKFSIPVVEEQQKIASVLTAADKEIEVLEAKLSHFKQEKKALMQQLLTGRRRVPLSS